MPYQTVDVKINKKTGEVKIEAEGFIGNQCDILSSIETNLGNISSHENKSERYIFQQPDYVPNSVT
jgi:hypothetical protein